MDKSLFDLYYNSIYFIGASLALLLSITIEIKKDNNRYNKFSSFATLSIFIAFLFLFSSRGINTEIGIDTLSYQYRWENLNLSEIKSDILLYSLMYILKMIGFTFQDFLFFTGGIYLSCFYFALRNICKKYQANLYLVCFCFISLFFFRSMGVNIIRQGISLGFFMLFISHFSSSRKVTKWLYALLAILTHATTVLPIIIYLLITNFNFIKYRYLYFIYAASLVLSFLSFNILEYSSLFDFLIDDKRISYISSTQESLYATGFKPQFVLFNTIFMFIFIYIKRYIKHNKLIYQINYDTFFKCYIILSALFFLSFQIPYSDRIGLMSWVTIPILISPIFSVNFNKVGIRLISIIFFIFIYTFFQYYNHDI